MRKQSKAGRLQGKYPGSLDCESGWDNKIERKENKKWASPLPSQSWLHFSITEKSLWSLGSSRRFKPPNNKNKSLYKHKKSVLRIWCLWALPFGEVLASSEELFFWWGKGLPIPVCSCFDVFIRTVACCSLSLSGDAIGSLSCWAPKLEAI